MVVEFGWGWLAFVGWLVPATSSTRVAEGSCQLSKSIGYTGAVLFSYWLLNTTTNKRNWPRPEKQFFNLEGGLVIERRDKGITANSASLLRIGSGIFKKPAIDLVKLLPWVWGDPGLGLRTLPGRRGSDVEGCWRAAEQSWGSIGGRDWWWVSSQHEPTVVN